MPRLGLTMEEATLLTWQIQEGDSFPDIKLPVPEDPSDRQYLGLSNEGTFKIKDIRADVVIVEIFNSG